MTSDFKCPFCGKSLWHPIGKPTWSCQNWDCLAFDNMIGNHTIWEKLIQSQKDLEIARKALEEIKENYEERFKAERDGFSVNWDIVAAFYARNIIANALKKIEHKE